MDKITALEKLVVKSKTLGKRQLRDFNIKSTQKFPVVGDTFV